MTDRAKVEFLAKKLGTLRNTTVLYSYIGNLRYKWNKDGEIIQISEPIKGGKNQWKELARVW